MLLQLEKINKTYQQIVSGNIQTVLHDLDFSMIERETVAIVGPSGSGKSTLLNLIGTLDRPDSGVIRFDREDVHQLNEDEKSALRNQKIGHVFQRHMLLPQLTLYENALLPTFPDRRAAKTAESEEYALYLFDKVGLTDKRTRYPYEVSMGECQRAAVVRAFINKPRLLLADEPTGSLDSSNADNLGNLLINMNEECHVTMLVVTHSEKLAAMMQRRLRIVNGKLFQA